MATAAHSMSDSSLGMSSTENSMTPTKTPDARDRILTAAISLFSARGFEGVSTTQIAKAAGITQPLIHYHFKNKEALWKAAAGRLFEQLNKDFSSEMSDVSQGDSKRFLVDSIRAFVVFSAKRPEFNRFLMREGAQQSDRSEWLAEELVKPSIQPFYEVYLEGVTDGWLRPIQFPQLLVLVVSAASNFFSLAPLVNQLFDVDPLDQREALKQSDAVIEIVMASIFKDEAQPQVDASLVTQNQISGQS